MFCAKLNHSSPILILLLLPTISFGIQLFSFSSANEQHQSPHHQSLVQTNRLNPFVWRAWKLGSAFGVDGGQQKTFGGVPNRLNPFIWRAWKRGMPESADPTMDLGIRFGKRQQWSTNSYVENNAALKDKLAELTIGFVKREEREEPQTIWQLSFH